MAPNLAVYVDRWNWITTANNGMLARYDGWRQQHNNIALADLGVNMNEDQLVFQLKGKLSDLWNVAQAFPDLLAWHPQP